MDFEIDVDVAPLLDGGSPLYVSSRWYELVRVRPERPLALQHKIEATLRNTLFKLQWDSARRRELERRRAARASILSRIEIDHEVRLLACDVSLAGLRAVGRPRQDRFDLEFRLPGLAFPVSARAEVANVRDANVVPLAGLKFIDIDQAYLEHIERYVQSRRTWVAANHEDRLAVQKRAA